MYTQFISTYNYIKGGDEYIRLMKSKLETEAEVEDGEVVLQAGDRISTKHSLNILNENKINKFVFKQRFFLLGLVNV